MSNESWKPTSATSSAVPPGRTGVSGTNTKRSAAVVVRWFKKLPKSDAQRLMGSNPSKTATLVKAGHPIEPEDFFLRRMFANAVWVRSDSLVGKPRDITSIDFECEVAGRPLGVVRLMIRHTPEYEAGQRNRTMELCWAGRVADALAATDVTGYFLTLERDSAGEYRLEISRTPSGPFLG